MPFRKKTKEQPLPESPARIALPGLPCLPEPERAFFDMLLQALEAGLHDLEKLTRKPSDNTELLLKCVQTRATVSYAQALLRLEALKQAQPGETAALPDILNDALNGMRRAFLFAGVTPRRPADEPLRGVAVPRELTLFLLGEMIACCLRCMPYGRSLHIGARRIGGLLLLGMRTEGEALQQAPLIPLLAREEDCEDYGFAVCRAIAALAGWEFRWEADEAGVRMFVDITIAGG